MTMTVSNLPRVACATLSVGLLALTACSSSSKSTNPGANASSGTSGSGGGKSSNINVLVDTSLTASAAQGGVSFPWPAIGVKAAAKAINAAGGINGHQIVVTVCDNKSDPNVSAQCARTAVSNKSVAVVGSFDGFGASQLLPVLQAAHIPDIGGLPASPAEFTNPVSFQFDPGAVLGGFALGKLMVDSGCQKVVILAPGIPSEPATLAGQKGYLNSKNVKVSSVDVPTTATDVSPVVSQALAAKPDCISFSGQGQLTSQMIVGAHKLGYTGKFITSIGSLLPQFLATLGPAADGVIVNSSTLAPNADDPMVSQFVADMTSYVGPGKDLQMDLNEFAQDGWSSVQLLKLALAGESDVSAATVLKKLPTMCDVNVGNVYPHVNFCKSNSSKLFPRTYNDQYRYLVAKNGQYVESDSSWHDASETVAQ